MAVRCVLCAKETPLGAKFCTGCGAPLAPQEPVADPLLGTTIADRYLIEAVIGGGAMGRVYRGIQRTLDRTVAIKLIDPRAFSPKHAADLTARFMTEARAASSLNHPNVVSIYDFGRTSPVEHAPLFLAMALLAGPSLEDVLEAAPAPLPVPRVVSILRQTLAALGEAHHVGITHRDVKPANIVLQRRRADAEHVTVIDFGVARIGTERKITGQGELLGTPHYMAPELITRDGAGPSVDLYAVGVILYELLTGRVPFDGDNALKVCYLHTSAPRPDPRALVPTVPDRLAEVCMRAMAIDVDARYPDAQALAEAIGEAASIPITRAQASVFPPRVSRRAAPVDPAPPRRPSPRPHPSAARTLSPRPGPSVDAGKGALVGLDEPLKWGRMRLADPRVRAVVYYGKGGTGRSTVLRELAAEAQRNHVEVVDVDVPFGSANEVGYSYLRALLARLAGLDAADSRMVAGHAADERAASTGLREIFGAPGTTLATEPGELRAAVVAAVAWAGAQAAARAEGRLVLIVADDLDRVDGVSRICLWDAVKGDGMNGVVLLATSELAPPAAPTIHARELMGLSRDQIAALVSGGPRPGERVTLLDAKASIRSVEPLYVEQYQRWRTERPKEPAPAELRDLVGGRISDLDPGPRRVLQALAVGGPCTREEVAALVERTEGLDEAVDALVAAGFALRLAGRVRVAHEAFARVALENAPAGVAASLHARAADVLAAAPIAIERRAYHRLRARPGHEGFILVDKAARLRLLRGDIDGAIAALSDAYAVARQMVARGELETSAWHTLGRKLATSLRDGGRADQARGVLIEILEDQGPRDPGRAPIARELAALATARGLAPEAERWKREEALALESPPPSTGRMPVSARTGGKGPVPSSRSSSSGMPSLRPRPPVRPHPGAEPDDDPAAPAPGDSPLRSSRSRLRGDEPGVPSENEDRVKSKRST